MSEKRIVWILGDQLSQTSNLFKDVSEQDIFVLIESKPFASQHKHHKQKLVFQFSAMRHFAQELQQRGLLVEYIKFNEEAGLRSSLPELVLGLCEKHKVGKLKVMKAADYDCRQMQLSLQAKLSGIELELVENDLFLSDVEEFKKLFAGKKHLLMESYYRHLRKKFNVLMNGAKPLGDKWNFDKENRKPLKNVDAKKFQLAFDWKPSAIVEQLITEVEEHFPGHYGKLTGFGYAVTRQQALVQLDNFCKYFLDSFGDYQDAMHTQDFYLYHSILSYLMNFGLLHPMEVVEKIESVYRQNPGSIPLNAAEGFIRQILGWREFIYCIYQSQMHSRQKPGQYRDLNFFNHTRSLPEFMWTAQTNMNCLKHSIQQTRDYAYAHHIQRLMVIGNFCLLAGLNPQEVCEWYLIVYIDALEWVELPNTLGMSQFADGGIFATKPYISSGNYINRMSNYCQSCHYDVKKSLGKEACPYNYLYWNFLAEKYEILKSNPRMGIALSNVARKPLQELDAIKAQSQEFLRNSLEMKPYKI